MPSASPPARSKDLYSVAANLYLGIVLAAIPAKTNGALAFTPKRRDGTQLGSRADALPPAGFVQSGPYLLPSKGTVDQEQAVRDPRAPASLEIKEWQAIASYLKGLPTKNARGVTVLSMDERVNEARSIEMRS